jgi:hypothetical protein
LGNIFLTAERACFKIRRQETANLREEVPDVCFFYNMKYGRVGLSVGPFYVGFIWSLCVSENWREFYSDLHLKSVTQVTCNVEDGIILVISLRMLLKALGHWIKR